MFREISGRGLVAAIVGLVLGCATPTSVEMNRARDEVAAGQLDAAVARIEALRDRSPGSPEVRDALGALYYRRARAGLDEQRLGDYTRDLDAAISEWVESVRLDPTSASPHTWMGIVAAYQGNLDSALQSFENALRLAPQNPTMYSNVAQTLIYQGKLTQGRSWLKKARRKGEHPAVIDMDLALAAWRQGDLVEARDAFDSAYLMAPEIVNTWDAAPVSDPIESFEDFTAYCCGSPACGPYMADACRTLDLSVRRREIADEAILEELRVEMERRRKLREIYGKRKDLQIEIDP